MSKMNRRNVLLGLGTAAAGSGIVFGSGAFTQVEADRDITIDVANDSDSQAIVQLEPNGDIDSVFENDDGALEIDLNAATDSDAVNIDSTVTIGTDFDDLPGDGTGDEAFVLTDNSGDSDEFDDVELIAELSVTAGEDDAEVDVKFEDDAGNDVTLTASPDDNTEDSEDLLDSALTDVDTGVDVALRIETGTSDSSATNIEADLIFTVNTE